MSENIMDSEPARSTRMDAFFIIAEFCARNITFGELIEKLVEAYTNNYGHAPRGVVLHDSNKDNES